MPSHRSLFTEWPTWFLLAGCYAGWLFFTWLAARYGLLFLLPAALLVTLHSSLQHEALHGHPTRSDWLNELLVFPALGLYLPYRRFRTTHREHHRDERLTDPFDDPESWYITDDEWRSTGPFKRALLSFNGTLLGRMLVGPALSAFGFWQSDWRLIRDGDAVVRKAWVLHLAGVSLVAGWLLVLNLSFVVYVFLVAYPAMSVLMIRTFIEHRAAEQIGDRTVVVEAGWLMGTLFLNNNLHAVHHQRPGVPWYELPAFWRMERVATLARNGAYHYPDGYRSIARRWLFRRREPLLHPNHVRADPVRADP